MTFLITGCGSEPEAPMQKIIKSISSEKFKISEKALHQPKSRKDIDNIEDLEFAQALFTLYK